MDDDQVPEGWRRVAWSITQKCDRHGRQWKRRFLLPGDATEQAYAMQYKLYGQKEIEEILVPDRPGDPPVEALIRLYDFEEGI